VSGFNRRGIERNVGIPSVDIVTHLAKVWIVDCLLRAAGHALGFVVIASGENANCDFVTCRNLR
jgi:hypothetical protein